MTFHSRVVMALLVFAAGLPQFLLAGGTVTEVDGVTLITVVVPSLPDPTDTSPTSRAQVAVVRQLEREFPEIFRRKYKARYEADPAKYGKHNWDNVALRLMPFSSLNVPGVESDLMSIAGGNPPDVLYVNLRKSDTYIRNGFLYPLDKLEDGYFTSFDAAGRDSRIHPKLWPVIDRKGPNGDRHVWALPFGGFLGRVLAYRKDLFDQAGISYPDASWTWEDMLAAAKKLTNIETGQAGMALAGEPGWEFTAFLWSAGGEVMTYDEATDEWSCAFGSREVAVALEYFTRLTMEPWKTEKGQVVRGYASGDSPKWDRGLVGMTWVYMDSKFTASLNPDLVGLAPVPKGPTGLRAAELNSMMYGIFSQIKQPAVRDAAWEYIAYQDSEPATALRTKMLVESGMGRFLSPKDLQRFGYPEVARLAPKGWAEVYESAVATGRPEPYGKNSNLAYRMLGRPISEAAQLSLRNALPADREARVELLWQILQKAEGKANEVMIGKVTPEERRTRSWAAAGFLLCVVVAFGFVFAKIFGTFTGAASAGSGPRLPLRSRVMVTLLLLPAVLSIVVWSYYPLFVGSLMGFQDYRILGDSTWVGLKNFGDMLWDTLWWQSLWNSLRFSVLFLIFAFLPPFLLAILLQEVPRGKITYRLLFYLPAVLAGLVTLLLWKQFYDPSPGGAMNAFVLAMPAIVFVLIGGAGLAVSGMLGLRFHFHGQRVAGIFVWIFGILFFTSVTSLVWGVLSEHGVLGLFRMLPEPIHWLRDPRYAMIACILPGIWAGAGPGCLIYLAALKGIPDDFYDAADIDGAGFLDKIITIVIPMLRPLLIISFIGAFIGSWMGSADAILAMTGGAADTEVAPLSIFYKAFVYLEYGPATAMAWMLAVMLIGFTVYQLRILANVEFRAAGTK